jgi:hypothetical protein
MIAWMYIAHGLAQWMDAVRSGKDFSKIGRSECIGLSGSTDFSGTVQFFIDEVLHFWECYTTCRPHDVALSGVEAYEILTGRYRHG